MGSPRLPRLEPVGQSADTAGLVFVGVALGLRLRSPERAEHLALHRLVLGRLLLLHRPDLDFGLRHDHVHLDRPILPEAMAALHAKVEPLEAKRRADPRLTRAVLPIQAEAGNRWLGDEDADAAILESEQRRFLLLELLGAAHLDGFRDGALELDGFVVGVTPADPRLRTVTQR